ncbi:gamma-mobile-trio protein GmtX [Marinomonas lutimaris]|uniref:gamma-mobile-trio protein GmtX n=1 Tax=Marinomonas lutimaris TaxID=2846746 RepID=UPI001CA4E4C4|nr:gamma-mobile-trio protein GmtX [Marinomonas lutimaris]
MHTIKEQIKATLESLCFSQKTEKVKHKLNILNEVCDELTKKKADLSIPLVVSQMTNNNIKISERSFYNQREGGNPYRELYNLWMEYSRLNRSKVKTRFTEDDIINDEDLKKILDPVLRYRINLLYAEVIALRNQNKMIREIKELPSIHSSSKIGQNSLTNLIEENLINSYEVDLIDELLKGTHEIGFDANGALIAKRNIKSGSRLLPGGLQEALEKIIKSNKRLN